MEEKLGKVKKKQKINKPFSLNAYDFKVYFYKCK